MTLSFCSFSSGSSGNCYLVKSDETAVLIDAGISCKKITDGLVKTKTNLDHLKALLVTHEHSDHVGGVRATIKKLKGISVYAKEETFSNLNLKITDDRKKVLKSGESFKINDLTIEAFSVSHDVETVGYHIRYEDRQISIVTDTGKLSKDILNKLADADILVIEANHDVNMLKSGSYPPFLKRRILGDEGHLSNEASGNYIADLMKVKNKARCILLAHLSSENNDPETAEQTVINILEENNWYNGQDVYVKSIKRDELSVIYEI